MKYLEDELSHPFHCEKSDIKMIHLFIEDAKLKIVNHSRDFNLIRQVSGSCFKSNFRKC